MKKAFLIGWFILFGYKSKAQQLSGFFTTLQLEAPAPQSFSNSSSYTPLSASFWFYKNFISSQDGSSCPFEISCSRYMVESVNKYGIVHGVLNGLDRLHRCNGLSNHKYPRTASGRLNDPLEW